MLPELLPWKCIAMPLYWLEVAESETRRKLMSIEQAAEGHIAGSASRKRKCIRMNRFHRRLRKHFFGFSELKLFVIRNWLFVHPSNNI